MRAVAVCVASTAVEDSAGNTMERSRMIEALSEALNITFPHGENTVDVTQEVCRNLTNEDLTAIRSVEVPRTKKE